MKILQTGQNWCVVRPSREARLCLQRLALKCGYRVGELCSELDCGERYFYTVFTRDVGLPPKEWMRRERMVVAKSKLADGKSPHEVAAELGFSTPNNFRREFQIAYQVSPLAFQLGRLASKEQQASL